MNLSYRRKILSIEKRIQQLYVPIRDLKELLNTYTPINRLPIELLSRVFNEIRLLNYEDSSTHELLWHRNIIHICRHWRNVGLDTPSLWNRISPPPGVNPDALTQYISMVGRNQRVQIVSHHADWELVLSHLEGSDARVTSLTAVGDVSFNNLLKVFRRFLSLSSVVSFNATDIRYRTKCSLPPGMPFFAKACQPLLQSLHLKHFMCISWKSLKPRFTGLHTLVACVPFTRREECTPFLGALQHMTSLRKLHIYQTITEAPNNALQGLYEEVTSHLQVSRPSPCDISLIDYGDLELRILLMSISLDNVQCIRLDCITQFQHPDGLPPLYETIKDFVPDHFLEAVQCVSLRSLDMRYYNLKGFRTKISSADTEELNPSDLAFELRGRSTSLSQQTDLPRVIRAAQLLAPNATSLHLVEPGNTRCRDGNWPGMEVLRAFPDIHTLIVDDSNAGAHVLPALGLSCLWKNEGDKKWHTTMSKWKWSGLKDIELGVGCVDWCYHNPYSAKNYGEITEFECWGGITEHWYPEGYIFHPEQVFKGADRKELLKLVSSLLPKLKVLELPKYRLSSEPDLEFLVTCIWFRNAVGLPIPQVVLPHQSGKKGKRFVALNKIVAGTTVVTMNKEGTDDGWKDSQSDCDDGPDF